MRLLLRLLLLLLTTSVVVPSFGQLSDLHYLPPLKQKGDGFAEQLIYLSTPNTTAFTVNVYKGTSTTILTTLTVSKSSPATYNPGNGDNNITLLTADSTGKRISTSGLKFVAPNGEKFYVNWRGKSGSQASSLTSKGRAALGKAFKWVGIPNRGAGFSLLTNAVGIMATENNTTVNIFGYNTNCTFRDGSNEAGNTADEQTITLNAGQTFVLEAAVTSLTTDNRTGWIGASITSDKDIAVSVGQLHLQPKNNQGGQDVGIDQITPENKLGKEYIFIRGNGLNDIEFPVIVATENDTKVYINGSATAAITLNIGDFYEVPATNYSTTTAGGNMYINTSKPVYAVQSLGGSSTADLNTGDMNFIAPVNCLLSNTIDNITNINSIAGVTISGGITILASATIPNAEISVKYGTNFGSTVSTTTLNTAEKSVTGTSEWKTFYIPNLTGNVSVAATGPIAVGFFGYSGVAGASGYFSGFETIPSVEVTTIGDGCLPSSILTATAGFSQYLWYNNGTILPDVSANTYTPTAAGSYSVTVSNGSCTYESASQNIFDCTPEIIVRTEADKTYTTPGGAVVFKVYVKYLGDIDVTNVVVNTTFPSNFSRGSSSATFGSIGASSPFTWTVGTMRNGEEHIMTINTTANSTASTVTGTMTVSTTQTFTGTESNKATDDFTETVTIYPTAPTCVDPSSGGTIATSQTGTSPFNPNAFTSTSAASGNTGTLEYKWQSTTTSATTGFSDISGATSTTYDPAALTKTTWFRRLAKVTCSADWTTAASSNVIKITVTPINWTGTTSNLWNVATNWSTGVVPTTNDNIAISTGTPELNTNFDVAGALVFSGTASLTVQAGYTLSVASGGTISLGDRPVTFKSSASGTAQLGKMLGNISGISNATIERYFPAKRAFRLFSSAVTTINSIKANWMENATPGVAGSYPYNAGTANNPTAGYGTHITGSGGNTNGFDASGTNNASLFTFNKVSQAWTEATSVSTGTITAGNAYRIYIRGDRGTQLGSNEATASATVLRTAGSLLSGTQTITLSDTLNDWSMVGNPFQSVVDMAAATKTNTTDYYYIWDPTLGTQGAYVAWNFTAGTSNNPSSAMNRFLQPGQAFFIQTTATAAASIAFPESAKGTAASQTLTSQAWRTSANPTSLAVTLYYADSLKNNANATDGLRVIFSDGANNAVDRFDAKKLENIDENISVNRNGSRLAMEIMSHYDTTTTIPLHINNYRQTQYTLRIKLENPTNSNFTAVLNDKYTGKKTTINAATDIPFDVNPNIAASIATDRFNIAFTKNTVTSVSNFSINGTNAQIKIQPNPIQNNTINTQINNLPAGKYTITLYDINGKNIAQTTYNHYNNNFSWKIPMTLNPGNYFLKWTGNNTNTTIKIVVE